MDAIRGSIARVETYQVKRKGWQRRLEQLNPAKPRGTLKFVSRVTRRCSFRG
jgi:hypothetical protein